MAKELKKLENGTFSILFHKAELPIYAESIGEKCDKNLMIQ